MSYLSNAAVNRLNIHIGLYMLAWNLAGNFFLVFLVSRGFSTITAFLALAFMMALRFAMRPVILLVAPCIGLNRTLLLGNFFYMLQYLFLMAVDGINAKFFAYCVVFGLADIFYWCAYHSMFAQVGDERHRGKQVGVKQAVTMLSAIFAPLAGGWLLQHAGPRAAFGAAAVIQLLASLPLLRLPQLPVARVAPQGAYSAARNGVMLFLTDGWLTVGLTLAWSILLFASTKSNFATFGGALAVAGLASALGALVLGHFLDSGRTQTIVVLNCFLLILDLAIRASVNRTVGVAFAIMAVGPLLDIFYSPTLLTAFYNIAAKTPCPLRFQCIAEGAWDIGCMMGALAAAGLLFMGAAPGWTIVPAMFGILGQAVILRKYYAAHRLGLVADIGETTVIR